MGNNTSILWQFLSNSIPVHPLKTLISDRGWISWETWTSWTLWTSWILCLSFSCDWRFNARADGWLPGLAKGSNFKPYHYEIISSTLLLVNTVSSSAAFQWRGLADSSRNHNCSDVIFHGGYLVEKSLEDWEALWSFHPGEEGPILRVSDMPVPTNV